MGERKGTNKYYPPDFDPQKHKSLAGYHGQHPLRERARKMSQGILIIRFEMPYNIWCDGCNNHIGMGVRYNAEKSKIGNYYTTPIYKFRMKCHLCDNHFEIKTDPANHDYVIICGARRKEQRWDPKENEQVVPEDRETHKKIERDAMYKLEHGSDDKSKLKNAIPGIKQIQLLQMDKKDDYLLNKLARQKFRQVKKAIVETATTDQALLEKSSLDLKLVEEKPEDVKIAKLLKYKAVESYDAKQKQKRETINSRPLFQSSSSDVSSGSSSGGSIPTFSPGALNRKQAALQKIGQASVNRRRSNPFGSDFSESNQKKSFIQQSLGIVRTKLVKEAKGDNKSTETETKPLDRVQTVSEDDTEMSTAALKPEVTAFKDSEINHGDTDSTKILNQFGSDNSKLETEKNTPNHALGSLLAIYGNSDSSGSED